MSDNRYNGWRNYATWRVNLELIDDYASSVAEDVEGGHVERFDDVASLAEFFEQYVQSVLEGEFGGPREGIAVDYAQAFVSDVDWYEIAEHWADELIAKEDEENDQ